MFFLIYDLVRLSDFKKYIVYGALLKIVPKAEG